MSARLEPYWLLGLALAAGLAIIQTGEYLAEHDESVPALEEKLKRKPDDLSLRERLGHALVRAGRAADAAPQFERVIAASPANVTAPYALASILAAQNQLPKAQDVLHACLKNNPEDAACNELLADLLVQTLGEEIAMRRASQLYGIAIRNDPTRASAALFLSKIEDSRGNLRGALSILDKPVKAHSRNAPLHLQAARLLAKAGKFNAAQLYFERGTVLDPRNAAAFSDYGAMLVDAGRVVAAERVLNTALELNPKNAVAKMHMGRALGKQAASNQIESKAPAMKAFQDAVTLDPFNARIYYEWANLHIESGEEAYAIGLLQEATDIDHDYADAWISLARLRMYAKDFTLRDTKKGLFALLRAVECTKYRDLGLLIAFSRAQARTENYDVAVDFLDIALKLEMTAETREDVGSLRQKFMIATFPVEDSANGIDIQLLLPRNPLEAAPSWPFLRPGPVSAGLAQPLQVTTKPSETAPGQP